MSGLLAESLLLAALVQGGDSVVTHPLDPLTAAEIATAREVLSAARKLGPEVRFASLVLREPAKDAVLRQIATGQFRRAAEAILFDWATSTPFRAQVDLGRRKLTAWDTLPSREPPSRNLIRRRLEEIVRQDPRWQNALRRRGLIGGTRITLIPGLGESQALPWRNQDRVVTAFAFDQESVKYPPFLSGIRLGVNLTRGVIEALTDSLPADRLVPLPSPSRTPPKQAANRPSSRRIDIDGIEVRGTEIRWHNWILHFGVHPRRGLELWDIGWVEGTRRRLILYRASISEVMSAYGDPGFIEWYPRDAGNAGMGDYQNNSAIEGGDAPEGSHFTDAVFADEFGRATIMPRAVAIYERDGGVLWRHAGTARRARELVVSSHSTIDDYDFVFNWVFREDAGMEVEVDLTGMMLLHQQRTDPAGPAPAPGSFGHLVAPGVAAANHQHFFSFRLDFDIDGPAPNRVLEQENVPVRQGRANPQGLWFAAVEQPLTSEGKAQRNLHTVANRRWRVVNPASKNEFGEATGYEVVPGEVAIPYSSARSPARRTGGFVGAQLWVTPYQREEMYAAGDVVNPARLDQGLPAWTRADRNLLDTDVVLWYTLGVTHTPRFEDYPVMPAHRASFRLLPSGFFSRNPAYQDHR